MKSTHITAHITKVNEELQKLASIIQNDKKIYDMTKEALLQCSPSDLSDNSFQQIYSQNNHSKPSPHHHLPPSPVNQLHINPTYASTHQQYTYGRHLASTQSQGSIFMPGHKFDSVEADITLKKFRPTKQGAKKNEENLFTLVENESRLLKSVKSLSRKKDSLKKVKMNDKLKKKQKKNLSGIGTQFKKIKEKTKCNKTSSSQYRFNDSAKMQINLKKQVTMKITDLKIKKQLCQKQSQYLSFAIKINEDFLHLFRDNFQLYSDLSHLKIYMAQIIIKFFSQFIDEEWGSDLSKGKIISILQHPNNLIKGILRLPDFLKKNNTLCKERCTELFEQIHFLQGKISSFKQIQKNQLYLYIMGLNEYISFLLNNSMIHETKRRFLDREPISSRSEQKNKTILEEGKQERKQYDSERKQHKKGGKSQESTLKKTKTFKVLSPKQKFKKK